jgi:hypothetical protein
MAHSIAAAPGGVRAKLREQVFFHGRMILSENQFPLFGIMRYAASAKRMVVSKA